MSFRGTVDSDIKVVGAHGLPSESALNAIMAITGKPAFGMDTVPEAFNPELMKLFQLQTASHATLPHLNKTKGPSR